MRKLITHTLISSILLGLFTFFGAVPVYSAEGTLYLSPASKTVNVGSNFTIAIRIDSNEININAVQANLSYPTGKLDFVSIDTSTSAFNVPMQETGGGGSVKIARMVIPNSIKGDKLVANVTFKAKSAGTATVSFVSGTVVVKDADGAPELTTTKNGGSYTINSTNPPPPDDGDTPKPPPSSTSTSTATTTTTTTPKKDTTAPKISGLRVSNIGFEKATISWVTNEKSSTVVEYGISKSLGIVKFNTKLTKSHSITLSKEILTPGTRFYYQVSSKDASGNVAKSKSTSFKTKGYSVKLRVLNLAGEPLGGAKIILIPDFDTVVADKNGFALFVDTAPGKHAVTIEIGDQKLAEEIIVEEIKDPEKTQEFVLKVAAVAREQGVDVLGYIPLLAIVVVTILAITGGWMGRNYLLSHKRIGGGGGSSSGSGSKPPQNSSKPKSEQKVPKPAQSSKELPSLSPEPMMPKNERNLKVVRGNDE